MRIATLQFSPTLGAVKQNIAEANALIDEAGLGKDGIKIDLLVGPELGFCGYNFPSLAAIKPYLEPTASGPTANWAVETAKRLSCVVCIGYAEREDPGVNLPGVSPCYQANETQTNGVSHSAIRNYNSQLVVAPTGALIAHYRKTHLYYTDESWAHPSPQGFHHAKIDFARSASKPRHAGTKIASFGICMDLNPHLFLTPWSNYEFATHAMTSRADIVICSMAWLTRLSTEELGLGEESGQQANDEENNNIHNEESASQLRQRPDLDTLEYWLERLSPLIDAEKNVTVVIANRCGIEPGNWVSPLVDVSIQQQDARLSDPDFPRCARFSAEEPVEIDGANALQGTEEARYAGTSCVLSLGRGDVRIVGVMGRAEERVRIWETEETSEVNGGTDA